VAMYGLRSLLLALCVDEHAGFFYRTHVCSSSVSPEIFIDPEGVVAWPSIHRCRSGHERPLSISALYRPRDEFTAGSEDCFGDGGRIAGVARYDKILASTGW
jgi:hypothetical protein